MNIAYFFSERSSYLGGADQTLLMQALLMKSSHQVTAILPCDRNGEYNTKLSARCKKHKVRYKLLPYTTAYRIRSIDLVNCSEDIIAIEQFVLDNSITFLHSVQINPAVEYISRKYHIPHVMNIYSLEDWEWKIPCPDILPRHVSCDSLFCLRQWEAYLNCKGKCVRVFSEMEIQKRKAENKNAIVMGAAGTVCAYKNQLELIKAAEILIDQGMKIKLVLAGEAGGIYAQKCREYIELHHLKEHVLMLGFVENMENFLEKIDVFVCGSKRESFPASIAEAFSCKIPVISTPVAGVPEILVNEENAYLTTGYSAMEIAETIKKFCRDYESGSLEDIVRQERNTYKQYFSAEAVKAQLEDLYQNVSENFFPPAGVDSWNRLELQIGQMARQIEGAAAGYDERQSMYGRALYFDQIRKKITAKHCYIWGAGRWGKLTKKMLQCFLKDVHIVAFIDNNIKGCVEGTDVIKKEQMDVREDTAVFISFAEDQQEGIDYLRSKNMEIWENIFIIA